MAWLSSICFYSSLLLLSEHFTRAQPLPTPPLQWLNLTGLLQGPSPPPLKDASIGYDDSSRSVIIFGGESQDGVVQSQSYLYVAHLRIGEFL